MPSFTSGDWSEIGFRAAKVKATQAGHGDLAIIIIKEEELEDFRPKIKIVNKKRICIQRICIQH